MRKGTGSWERGESRDGMEMWREENEQCGCWPLSLVFFSLGFGVFLAHSPWSKAGLFPNGF